MPDEISRTIIGTCGDCQWSEVHKSGNAICRLPEGFMMDAVTPPNWGCIDWTPIAKQMEVLCKS